MVTKSQIKNSDTIKAKILLNKQGFTLIELIIVMVIIGVVSSVTIPRYVGSFESTKFKDTMYGLVCFMGRTHNTAMSTGKRSYVIFDLHNGFCWNSDKKIFMLPDNFEIFADSKSLSEETNKVFTFFPNGMASEEKLGFSCDNTTAILHVESLGGAVSYKMGGTFEQAVRYARSGIALSQEEIQKNIDKWKDSDKLTEEEFLDKLPEEISSNDLMSESEDNDNMENEDMMNEDDNLHDMNTGDPEE